MRIAVIASAAVALLTVTAATAQPGTREIAFVANAEGATVSLVDLAARKVIREIDVNPEKIVVNRPGTPNYAQDTDASPDGRTLYVSRGYAGDVAAFDIASGRQLWATRVDPTRADHMVISHDGKHLFVSAYTQARSTRLDAKTGAITGQVVTGVSPHDNQISADGRRLFNSSIGNMGVPVAERDNVAAPSAASGYAYQMTIAEVESLKPVDAIRFEKGIRPWRFAPGEKAIYAQFSNEHAVVAYDLAARKLTKRLELPVKPGVTAADWDFEAYHHGLAITPDGRTLCIAGRASDYAALVRVPELTLIATIPAGDAPGWSEVADNGRLCLVTNTRSDDFSIISIPERREIARLKLGNGPKHITVARAPNAALAAP